MYSVFRPLRECPRGLQRDVVYLGGWPIAPSYTSPNAGGWGGGGCGVSGYEYSCAHHVNWSPNKLWRSTSIFNLWNAPWKWCRKCPKLSAYVSVVSSRGKVEVGNGSTAVQCAYVWKTYIIESTNTAYPRTDDRTIETSEKKKFIKFTKILEVCCIAKCCVCCLVEAQFPSPRIVSSNIVLGME
jgi:hypothetical protein